MSLETQVYSAVVKELKSLFIDKMRLPNPYDIEANPLGIKDGWGLKIGAAQTSTLETCSFSFEREYTVILMRKLSKIESKSDSFDDITGLLMDDSKDTMNIFLNNEEFGVPDLIDSIAQASISGIQSLNNGDESYLFVELSFNILISESYS